jgi:methionyl-tRNA formyltransferase
MQWSLIQGEARTGVTAFWLEEGLDTGPICRQADIAVDERDNAVTLREKLIALGGQVLDGVLDDAAAGRAARIPQAGTPTFAPPLKKENGVIRWSSTAREIVNLIRGVVEWPGAVTTFRPDGTEKKLKIFRASATEGRGKTPGEILGADAKGIVVQSADEAVLLEEVQPEGKKAMPAWSFWQGARLKAGDKFGG